jgi:hypothetical protein
MFLIRKSRFIRNYDRRYIDNIADISFQLSHTEKFAASG